MPRSEFPSAGILLEWDLESAEMSLVQLMGATTARRDHSYGLLQTVQYFLSDVGGLAWDDLELSERYRRMWGDQVLALTWRSIWPEGSERPAEMVLALFGALGGGPSVEKSPQEAAGGPLTASEGFGGVDD